MLNNCRFGDGLLLTTVQTRVSAYVADRLRGIPNGLRYDFRRAEQLRALADGFERFATRLEQEADLDAAK